MNGRWQCLRTAECEDAREQRTFAGPTQAEAQQETKPLRCPACGSLSVLYIGENTPAEAGA